MNEQNVRAVLNTVIGRIDSMRLIDQERVRHEMNVLIARKERRAAQLRAQNAQECKAGQRLHNEMMIVSLEQSVDTLIELAHNLRLCDCPEEAYSSNGTDYRMEM